MALNDEMSAVFKSSRTDLDSVPDNTVGVDPESGNEIPIGSLPEEVRDDIPAQLSEGEYVVPADVVRYYGVKFFEDLRADAKFGYQDMEENGRIGGEPPMGMEMVEPEDDMMFDVSELEVMEVPDEPEGAFFGKLFGSKKEEPSVRERFDAAAKRDNSAKGIARRQAERRAAETARKMADADYGDGPSIAEQINFGGDYEDTSSSSSGSKSKPKKESAASKTVRRAYTGAQEDDGQTFAEKINFGGKYNNGGYALNPGDPGYDEMGSLGLGSEGLPLGTGEDIGEGAAVEMVAYVNEEGRVIYIMHINGVPQNEIPAGFYPRTEEEATEEEDATTAQPTAQVVVQSGDDGGAPDMDTPEAIRYETLTLEELQDLANDIYDPKKKAIMNGLAAIAGPMGLAVKAAMMHQESRLRKEMERRLDGELTTQERTQLEGMLHQANQKKGLLGTLKGKVADLAIGPEQGPGMDIQPPTTYTPEVTAGDVTTPDVPTPESIITTTELPDMDPFRQAGQEAGEAARSKVLGVTTPPSIGSESDPNVREARSSARQGTQDVLDSMRDRGASREARTAAVKEGARIESVVADQAKGIKRGFKKGGLASKKKKK